MRLELPYGKVCKRKCKSFLEVVEGLILFQRLLIIGIRTFLKLDSQARFGTISAI